MFAKQGNDEVPFSVALSPSGPKANCLGYPHARSQYKTYPKHTYLLSTWGIQEKQGISTLVFSVCRL